MTSTPSGCLFVWKTTTCHGTIAIGKNNKTHYFDGLQVLIMASHNNLTEEFMDRIIPATELSEKLTAEDVYDDDEEFDTEKVSLWDVDSFSALNNFIQEILPYYVSVANAHVR